MRNRAAAFTLIEILTSIAIFLLLASAIFTSVRTAFVSTAQVATSQLDSERMAAFQQFMRQVFVSLPPDAKLELRKRVISGRGDVVEVLIWPAPTFLQFGPNAGDGAAISARPDGKGGFRMEIGYFRADEPPDKREERLQNPRNWLSLLPGVKDLRWRFAPSRNPVFEDTWTNANGRPGLAELSLQMAGEDEPTAFTYWIPPLQRRSFDSPAVPDSGPGGASGPVEQEPPRGEEPGS